MVLHARVQGVHDCATDSATDSATNNHVATNNNITAIRLHGGVPELDEWLVGWEEDLVLCESWYGVHHDNTRTDLDFSSI